MTGWPLVMGALGRAGRNGRRIWPGSTAHYWRAADLGADLAEDFAGGFGLGSNTGSAIRLEAVASIEGNASSCPP